MVLLVASILIYKMNNSENFIVRYPITSVQLTTTDPMAVSLNGYMVAPREDKGTPLDVNVSYVGSWEDGTDMKFLCNGVCTLECELSCFMSISYS